MCGKQIPAGSGTTSNLLYPPAFICKRCEKRLEKMIRKQQDIFSETHTQEDIEDII
jgi:hypothetical protein